MAAVLVLNTPDDGRLGPKHVEWLCRNKTCTVLHQVGVSFDWQLVIVYLNWANVYLLNQSFTVYLLTWANVYLLNQLFIVYLIWANVYHLNQLVIVYLLNWATVYLLNQFITVYFLTTQATSFTMLSVPYRACLSSYWLQSCPTPLRSSYITPYFGGGHHQGRQHHRPKNAAISSCLSCHTHIAGIPPPHTPQLFMSHLPHTYCTVLWSLFSSAQIILSSLSIVTYILKLSVLYLWIGFWSLCNISVV